MQYMLSESAARKLRTLLRDPSAAIPTQIGQTRKVRPDSAGGVVAGTRFHFDLEIKDGEATVGEGFVQVGGYSYASSEQSVELPEGDALLCLRVDLDGGSVTAEFFTDVGELNAAQDDMRYYIFPIYKISNGAKAVDYRPLPQAGCWESR